MVTELEILLVPAPGALPELPGFPDPERFLRGDCDIDGGLGLADAVFGLSALFSMGTAPQCDDACDFNDDGNLGLADMVGLLAHLFSSGAPPPEPTDGCDVDPTADSLDCENYPCLR